MHRSLEKERRTYLVPNSYYVPRCTAKGVPDQSEPK